MKIDTPTIDDFTNSQHNHSDAVNGGTLTLSALSDITATSTELNYLDGFAPTANQVAFGNGSILTSSADFTFDGSTLNIAGLTKSEGVDIINPTDAAAFANISIGSLQKDFVIDLSGSTATFARLITESPDFGLILNRSDGGAGLPFGNIYVTSAADSYISIGVNANAAGLPFHITGNGIVNIGTTSGTGKLNLVQNSNQVLFHMGATGGTATKLFGRIVYDSAGFITDGGFIFQSLNDSQGFTSNLVTITRTAKIGIGVLNPTFQLQLAADSAAKPTTNTWTIVSDKRIKKNIEDFTDGLEKVLSINPKLWHYNGEGVFEEDDDSSEKHIGIVADDLVENTPYLVGEQEMEIKEKMETIKTYEGHAIPFMLINAVKELNAEILTLKEEINLLKSPK